MPPILYNVAIETGDESLLVEWSAGVKGWAEALQDTLDSARAITLIPADPAHTFLPVVSVDLRDENRRWVLFSTVFGKFAMGDGAQMQIRVYCLGWQTTIGVENLQQKIWIYPNGAIEIADEPTMTDLLFEKIRSQQDVG